MVVSDSTTTHLAAGSDPWIKPMLPYAQRQLHSQHRYHQYAVTLLLYIRWGSATSESIEIGDLETFQASFSKLELLGSFLGC